MNAGGADGPRVRTSAHPWGTRVVLGAPQVRNALDPAAVSTLLDVFTGDAVATEGPGAVLLTADGSVFCAGGDLSVLSTAAAEGGLTDLLVTRAAAFADLIEAMVACPRPVVAAIDGPAVGGGVSLALACDVRLATPRARLVLGWARWGLPPDGGAAALLTAAVGAEAARSLLADSAEIDTESAFAPQLLGRVVPPERLEAEAIATVTALASSPGAATAKATAAAPLLAALRAGRGGELAAVERAAGEATVVAGLANVYKMKQ